MYNIICCSCSEEEAALHDMIDKMEGYFRYVTVSKVMELTYDCMCLFFDIVHVKHSPSMEFNSLFVTSKILRYYNLVLCYFIIDL